MKKRLLLIILSSFVLLAGCSTSSSQSETNSTESSATTAAETTSATEATTASESETTTTKAKAELVLPLTENTSGKVMIQTISTSYAYKSNSYIITSVDGESVVVDPTSMPPKETIDLNPAAIVNTHGHNDHYDDIFQSAYDCEQIRHTIADINTKDFHIYTVQSAHSGDVINETTENVIAVFEVNGLRIAHFGDCGQTAFTDEQLKQIGDIDIAFMQFENSYSSMTLANEKGFKLMEQVNPTIVIPTHYMIKTVDVFEEKYGDITECENVLEISKEDLPEEKLNFYIIENNHKYQ